MRHGTEHDDQPVEETDGAFLLRHVRVPDAETEAWRDDVLALGGRLRAVYGNAVQLEPTLATYRVGHDVTVSCSAQDAPLHTVCFAALVSDGPELARNWRSVLREGHHCQLAWLACDQKGRLGAFYELPFAAACGPFLQAGVTAVGRAARSVRRNLGLADQLLDAA